MKAIGTDYKEWMSTNLWEKLRMLGYPGDKLVEKGALILWSIFERRELGDIRPASDNDWYANKIRQQAIDYPID